MKPNAFVRYVLELLQSFEVTARGMFGGYGLYRRGLIFAIIADDQLYLKADATTQGEFEAAGSEPFTYESRGRLTRMSYWLVPAQVLDDEDALCTWAEKAYKVAQNKKNLTKKKI
jgi:DNA transformation protein and related proteins